MSETEDLLSNHGLGSCPVHKATLFCVLTAEHPTPHGIPRGIAAGCGGPFCHGNPKAAEKLPRGTSMESHHS